MPINFSFFLTGRSLLSFFEYLLFSNFFSTYFANKAVVNKTFVNEAVYVNIA